ncbi:MAG: type I-G CRISPR-associated protein Cas8g1/Csx17 [Methanotrichaceae archaeon]
MTERFDLELGGCSPVPLASYLKALGVFRLVAEQVDAGARCYWREDVFHILSMLDGEALMEFFLNSYSPTPVVAPWNGGSGFYYREEKLKDKDPATGKRIKTGKRNQPTAATRVVDTVVESSAPRLASYREALKIAKEEVDWMGLKQAPSGEEKNDLIQAIRNGLPDPAIAWLDASVVLTEENAKYPPLLGTGGNDGNTDFSSNFMQRLGEVFQPADGRPGVLSSSWLEGSLFSTTSDDLVKGVAIGQFYPGAVGGPNAESGFGSDSLVNPWDFVLMIEGSLFFAAATVKRLQASEPGVLSYPFTVNSSGVGYGSASKEDEKSSRAEVWVPLWDRSAGLEELKALMGEGRAQVGRRRVRNGVDFARAVASLGVDRGLRSFQRYGFLERNGRAYFAVPLDRINVSRQPQVDLLNEIDPWLVIFGERARSTNAPASVGRTLRRLEVAIISFCKEGGPGRVQDVLISLGRCERSLVKSLDWTREVGLWPVPPLSEKWLTAADDGSPEFRLAASLASIYGEYRDKDGKLSVMTLRAQMEPVHAHRRWAAFDEAATGDVVWSEGDPVSALNKVMARRITRAVQSGSESYPDRGRLNADLGDVAEFIEGRVDLGQMVDLLWGLILLDWPSVSRWAMKRRYSPEVHPGAGYGLLKLCFTGREVQDVSIPLVPEIQRRATHGESYTAMQLAERRLRGSGLSPALGGAKISGGSMERIATALLFPLAEDQIKTLAERVLRPESGNDERKIIEVEE